MDANESTTPFIAAEVKRLRKERGMTQGQLASVMTGYGVTWRRTTVVHLEIGKREQVTINELFALADALDVNPADLIPPRELRQSLENVIKGCFEDTWAKIDELASMIAIA